MIGKLLAVLGLTLVAGLPVGCIRGVHGGDPALLPSGTNGTAKVFQASEKIVLAAISNAFATVQGEPIRYHGMHLYPASQEAYLIPAWQPTNGFVLFPLHGPIADVPLRGHPQVSVPYTACFNITITALASDRTRVTVRTLFATVTDGQEIGVHGGWANHGRTVPPIKAEEDKVVLAISQAVVALKGP